MNSSLPQFESSYLTPARLQWVMDVGETTVAEWIKGRELDYFKKGRLIRFSPADVMQFIQRYKIRARGMSAPGLVLETPETWGRIERLIRDQVEHLAQLERRAA